MTRTIMQFPEENKKLNHYCRVYILLASHADKAVILRNGPSEWTQMVVWNTATDNFEYGQWIKGGLKVRQCDLSPKGKHLIYFVQKYHAEDPAYTTFTAISKPPNFTALTLWPLGDSWHGGGFFISDTELWLNHPADKKQADPRHPNTKFTLVALPEIYKHHIKNYEPFIDFYRRVRDGWSIHGTFEAPEGAGNWEFKYPTCERKHPTQHYTLIVTVLSTLKEFIQEFYLKDTQTNEQFLLTDVSWADFDHAGRLIMVRYGMILAGDLSQKLLSAQVLVDLNSQKPVVTDSDKITTCRE